MTATMYTGTKGTKTVWIAGVSGKKFC